MPTAHLDTFARDNLPPLDQQPQFCFDGPDLQFPEQLNCAAALLDEALKKGWGEHVCIRAPGGVKWTYADLQDKANRIAKVLVHDMGLLPGQRVLLRAPNNPMLAACWFAVVKAGGITVATMPMLRAKELKAIVQIGRVSHALCDVLLAEELKEALPDSPSLKQLRWFNSTNNDPSTSLEAAMAQHSPAFTPVNTAADDCCMFAFTSGTTGVPKCTLHFHRDVMAACYCWPPHHLKADAQDVFMGSPPLAFTFGLGGLLLFPMSVGASTVLLEKATPPALLQAVPEYGATVLVTAPTSYRALAPLTAGLKFSVAQGGTLRKCVSAGEALPAATRALWKSATGIDIIDGIGSTELLHIFISHPDTETRPGATGKAVPGYRAKVVDDAGQEVSPGTIGKLAVQGPTGCRYLNDPRQQTYVQNGWNLTGDAYLMDADGWFHYQARTDDMIVSSGYNIAGPEVEEALMQHPAVAECGVVGVPDAERGHIVKAFVVLRSGYAGDPGQVKVLQDFVKAAIAPYKYPRAISFVSMLPRTATGKLQRFVLAKLDAHNEAA